MQKQLYSKTFIDLFLKKMWTLFLCGLTNQHSNSSSTNGVRLGRGNLYVQPMGYRKIVWETFLTPVSRLLFFLLLLVTHKLQPWVYKNCLYKIIFFFLILSPQQQSMYHITK